jgi:phosphoribosylaminoimidazolecarboxamide formyltransferase/IMP cyclohydrolase
VAQGFSLVDAYNKALNCDQTSAFGGIIALNDTLDKETAEQISQIFTEVVIAPNATDEAKAIFANKKNLRLLTTQGLPDMNDSGEIWRQVSGGYLIQDRDNGSINRNNLEVVTKRNPTENEISDMLFAWKVAKHVKSNAIVYVKDNATVGIGAGQMNRLDSTRIAARKSKDMSNNIGLSDPLTIGSVVASDAFFPFSDGLLAAAEAGATSIIQPGGSMRDDEVISAANDAGLAMVFTNMRHFKH